MRYIVVTGGVISGLGKGITASSIGYLLKSSGYNVTAIKIDPYLNIDAGTMSPHEHGECYVLRDGTETDLDLGNYERFLGIHLDSNSSITTGKVYNEVLKEEREGKYLGKTVQVVPHITNKIKEMIKRIPDVDFCIIELGGTIGDIESLPFVEALRTLEDTLFVHVSLIPLIGNGEEKTKPTQHSVKTILSLGIKPDLLCLRCEKKISKVTIEKVAYFCNINASHVITNNNYPSIYEVPLTFYNQNVHNLILKKWNLNVKQELNLNYWKLASKYLRNKKYYKIGIAGKYNGNLDSYLSLVRAIEHASIILNKPVEIEWLNFENAIEMGKYNGFIVPGGFGQRNTIDMIGVSQYCREKDVPYLGICLGMQILAIDVARNCCGIEDANSLEFGKHITPIVTTYKSTSKLGGTMCLGLKDIIIKKDSSAYSYYKKIIIQERHRHRYHINKFYLSQLEQHNLMCTGLLEDNVEILEYPGKFCVGVQYHPEFETSHQYGHPLFIEFLKNI